MDNWHPYIVSTNNNPSDEIGMDETYVKLTDVMDSLDLLRSNEKKSSEVLTKLSHRLDTTDFANAFNVTSKLWLSSEGSDELLLQSLFSPTGKLSWYSKIKTTSRQERRR